MHEDDAEGDADLQAAANGLVAGVFAATGQTCMAGSRLVVHADVHDELVRLVAERASQIVLGDPFDEDTEMGPVANGPQYEKVVGYLSTARDEGAQVAHGGGPSDKGGYFVSPTVFADVTPEMRAYAEEIFGPVAVVYKVKDVDEAVELANSSPFGLGGSVFGADEEQAAEVAQRVDSGMVFVNGVTGTAPDLPFGGVKRSGVGRELGPFGIEEFANKKLLHLPRKK